MSWHALGQRIRELRERRGLTQADLAEAAEVSRIYIRKLEAGDRMSPSLPVLERIARALNATLEVNLIERTARRGKGG